MAVEIPGVASIGAEPFAPADRIEKRWQVSNTLSSLRASHTYKTGLDLNYIPAVASFPLNQSGLYAFPTTLPVDFPFISSVLGPQITAALGLWSYVYMAGAAGGCGLSISSSP